MASLSVRDREALRTRLSGVRDSIEPVDRLSRAETIAANLGSLPAFAEASAIAFYYSVGSEVPTHALIQRVVEEEGRRAFLPYVANGQLELAEWRPSDPVIQGDYVSFQPRFRHPAALDEIEAIVVPGLAFDPAGHRLGSGRGLHDDLLGRLAVAIRIGVGFDEQVVDDVPAEDTDAILHHVVTDERILDCRTVA